ncbi:unnamed protein product, partial [Durusdinium trenchii]
DVDFQSWASAEWNPDSNVPLSEWLLDSRSDEEQLRMNCLGNIVVPRQAALGVCALNQLLLKG